MSMLRNIVTAVWCAVVIGTNTFALILVARNSGGQMFELDGFAFATFNMMAMIALGVISLISTKFLWAMLALALISMFLTLGIDLLVHRIWRPAGLLGSLFLIVPTYLIARWNSLSRRSDFNPVKEF